MAKQVLKTEEDREILARLSETARFIYSSSDYGDFFATKQTILDKTH